MAVPLGAGFGLSSVKLFSGLEHFRPLTVGLASTSVQTQVFGPKMHLRPVAFCKAGLICDFLPFAVRWIQANPRNQVISARTQEQCRNNCSTVL